MASAVEWAFGKNSNAVPRLRALMIQARIHFSAHYEQEGQTAVWPSFHFCTHQLTFTGASRAFLDRLIALKDCSRPLHDGKVNHLPIYLDGAFTCCQCLIESRSNPTGPGQFLFCRAEFFVQNRDLIRMDTCRSLQSQSPGAASDSAEPVQVGIIVYGAKEPQGNTPSRPGRDHHLPLF